MKVPADIVPGEDMFDPLCLPWGVQIPCHVLPWWKWGCLSRFILLTQAPAHVTAGSVQPSPPTCPPPSVCSSSCTCSWHSLHLLSFSPVSLKVIHWSVSSWPVNNFVVIFRRWTRHFSPWKVKWDVWVAIHQLLLRPEWKQMATTSPRTESRSGEVQYDKQCVDGEGQVASSSFVLFISTALKSGPRAHTSWALAL